MESFLIERYSEDEKIPAWYGFFYRQAPADTCDSIVNWERPVDITGFSEAEHADMFKGDPKFLSSRNRTTLLEVLQNMNLCVHTLFPGCKSPLNVHRGVLKALTDVKIDYARLRTDQKSVWFLKKRERYESQGELKERWVRMTEQEMLEAIEAGDILLDMPVRAAARTVFGKKGADWTAFEINDEKVLLENSKMGRDFKFDLYYANPESRLMSILWTDKVSTYATPVHLKDLCDNFRVSINEMPDPEKNKAGKPIDILIANWVNKVRLDWRTYYPLYLKSADWYLVRQLFFMFSQCTCANVGCDAKATQIHHASYMNVACENIEDLLPLCNRCHAHLHNQIRVLEMSDVESIQQRHENREVSSRHPQSYQTRLRLN